VQPDFNAENPAQLDLCLHCVAPILTCSDNALITWWTAEAKSSDPFRDTAPTAFRRPSDCDVLWDPTAVSRRSL